MIDRMTRYDFILLSEETDAFLVKLQELGLVDIQRSVKAIDEKSAAMLAEADAMKKRMALLSREDFARDEKYAGILAEMAAARKEIELRAPWGEFDKAAVDGLEKLGRKMRFYKVSKKKFDEGWAELVPLQVIQDDGTNVWFVTVSETGEAYEFPVAECAAPEGTAADARGALADLEQQLSARKDELLAEKQTLPQMQAAYEAKVAETDFYFATAAKEGAAEGALTVYTGFAPSENDQALKAAFDEMDIFYTAGPANVDDNPPIRLKNNKFVKMFEVLTDMYGRPAYNGFDPTPYISIFFMLFFAMCMGDAGYGILLVIIGALLKKVKSFANLAPLVMVLGCATFVVGFFFHTFFSIDISQWGFIQNSGISKIMVPAQVAGYDGTMILALVVGIIHLCLAMVVKTVYATKNKGFLGSLSIWGWTLLIVGGVIVAACAIGFHLDSAVTKWILIGLGGVSALGIFFLNDLHRNPLKNVGAGLWETYNTITGVLGDVLSYLRLYALGLAGSMLGYAFNDLAKMVLGDGGVGWVFFILIAVVGHTLNIAMAALGAFVHPLRLNFLEFFKNSGYEAAGRKYNPLKK